MVVDGQTGWSTGSFTHNHLWVYREWSLQEQTLSQCQLCGGKCLVDVRVRGQKGQTGWGG